MKPFTYKILTSFFFSGLLFLFSACQKKTENIPNNNNVVGVGTLEFILKTTDMDGNTKVRFSYGENFMLTLIIKNHSKQKVELCKCFLDRTNPDLLGVYSNISFTKDSSNAFIGKPWDGVGNYFIAPMTAIEANSSIIFSLPWEPDISKHYQEGNLPFHLISHPSLPIGQYYTKFNFNYNDHTISLKYNFAIN